MHSSTSIHTQYLYKEVYEHKMYKCVDASKMFHHPWHFRWCTGTAVKRVWSVARDNFFISTSLPFLPIPPLLLSGPAQTGWGPRTAGEKGGRRVDTHSRVMNPVLALLFFVNLIVR